MRAMNMKTVIAKTQLLPVLVVALALLLTASAYAAAPGITGTSFSLTAGAAFSSQPDGALIYSWGYGCTTGFTPTFDPPAASMPGAACPTVQIPGPTLIVNAGTNFTVTLTNNLPAAAGNTSILFPGFAVATSNGVPGLLTQEAAHAGTVTYTVTVPLTAAGTHSYYSGTQGDLQVEMGLYGAIIVLPTTANTAACDNGVHASNVVAQGFWQETDFRLAHAAYDHAEACYDREYLFQFSEMDPIIHRNAEEQVATSAAACTAGGVGSPGCSLNVPTEPYHAVYFLINGRSMPDLMDTNYAPQYAHQPYNGNPHLHPGELVLLRIIGQGRMQHPFHEHGNHVRILGRDGNLLLSATDPNSLAGPALFTTTTTPGMAMDGIYYWTGRGLNWDAYGHNPASTAVGAELLCTPDGNGYNTGAPTAINYFEWCADHDKPLEANPFGDIAGGGPVSLPDPNIMALGAWYGGSAYLGPNATVRAVGSTGTIPPSGTVANSPTDEAGFAFMWHSHNEREITTNNIFPGGMMMMMMVDSREFVIDESN